MEEKCTLSNKELIERSREIISELAKTGGKSWSLQVPVNFNRDPDMIFSELGNRLQQVEDYSEPNYSSIEQLTLLQQELGYKEGELSTVAMLGLVGEAGEVLSEAGDVQNSFYYAMLPDGISQAISFCKNLDDYKKVIRKDEYPAHIPKFDLSNIDVAKFKTELGDVVYCLNILATNLGLTLFDLAQMSHDKVRSKQANGGSSEDLKS